MQPGTEPGGVGVGGESPVVQASSNSSSSTLWSLLPQNSRWQASAGVWGKEVTTWPPVATRAGHRCQSLSPNRKSTLPHDQAQPTLQALRKLKEVAKAW